MSFIETIEIKNFKSIRHQKIEGCKRVNVFIGYPNVGKSNILEAISTFSIDHSTNLSQLIRMENNTTLFFNGNINNPIEILLNDQHKYSGFYYSDALLRFIYQVNIDSKGFEEINRINNFSSKDFLRKFDIKDNKNVSNFEINNLPPYYNFTEVKRYIFSEKNQYGGSGFDKLSQPNGDNVFDIISVNEQIRKEISDLFKQYDLKFSFDKSTRQFKILKNVGDDIFLIPYSMTADTFQRLILFKTAILSNRNTVLLFEEPEAHMFPPFISKFTSDMVNDENKNQFFITTHSPFVLNDLIENLKSDELAIYIVSYKKETGETLVHRMSEEDMHEAYQFGYDFFMNMDKFITEKQDG